MQDYTHIVHPFEPVFDINSKILVLGSFPSVKSRENGFFYGHPQNRFWKVLATVLEQPLPITIEQKKQFLLRNCIAVWDSIYSCDIVGSSDSSIKNAVPTDLIKVVAESRIESVFCNGTISGKMFEKYQKNDLKIEAITLPSTSAANAAFSIPLLCERWKIIREVLEAQK